MSAAEQLLLAILGAQVAGRLEARAHLAEALELQVDPLDYCAHRFGLGEALVMQRAAAWAELRFLPALPADASHSPLIHRIDQLGGVRSIRVRSTDGTETVCLAPRFDTLLRLKAAQADRPDLAGRISVVPASAIRAGLAQLSAGQLMDWAKHRLIRRWPRAAGEADAPRPARLGFVALLTLLVVAMIVMPWVSMPLFLPLMATVLLLPALLRIAAALLPQTTTAPPRRLDDDELPIYTLLLPLRDEAAMVGQLAEAVRRLDYPPEKLDVLFVVETRSLATVAAAQAELHDPRFQLVVVPDALPRTKPKALNYALPLARGAYVAVYDAEDIPERGQLRLAADTFAAEPDVMCLQAELVIDNARESRLAALFAGEYAGQFGLLLPLLARLGLPMPLGGTSNHFRLEVLRQVGGWDAFNVTEDADLGVRLARLHLRTGTIASHTGEEAPIHAAAWLKQRTRWMKGFMQTLLVHNRDVVALWRDLGWMRYLALHLYVGSMLLSAPLHTTFLLSLAVRLATVKFPIAIGWGEALTALVFTVGYLGPALLVVAGLARLRRLDLLPAQLLLPFYWILHSVAMVLAARELVLRPFAWSKTQHGETRVRRAAGAAGRPVQAE